jgi:hypothetical protein
VIRRPSCLSPRIPRHRRPPDRGIIRCKAHCASDGASPSANPKEIGVRGPEKTDRPWRLVTGAQTAWQSGIVLMTSAGTPTVTPPAHAPPTRTHCSFPGHRQDASLANRFTKPSTESQVIAERNVQLGKLWLMQPYASGPMEPAQNSFRPRCEVIKDFLTLGVEVLAPRQWYARSRFRIYLCYAQLVPSIRSFCSVLRKL